MRNATNGEVCGSRLAQRIFPSFAPMSPGFDPRPRYLYALGFQSKLASAGFFSGHSGFPPASKTGPKKI